MKHNVTVHMDESKIHGFNIGAIDLKMESEFNSDEAETVGSEIRMLADSLAQKFQWIRVLAEKGADIEFRRREAHLEKETADLEIEKASKQLKALADEKKGIESEIDDLKWQKRKLEITLEQKKGELPDIASEI